MRDLSSILIRMPDIIKDPLENLPENIKSSLEEIRIQINRPILVRAGNKELIINLSGRGVTHELLEITLNNLMNYSIYAYEEELAKGYITIEGGHRVGICGRVVNNRDCVTLIKDISSINIRRSREIIGVADPVMKHILDQVSGLQNTIIVSPPKCGKTTLLRDIIRVISNNGHRVSVCDERSEIAGMYQGIPAYELGLRTDVLDGCLKAEGMMMLLRSMAPDVIVTDEIGKDADVSAIESAVSSGVKIITTIHGNTYDDLLSSRLGKLINNKTFTRIIYLTNIPSTGTIKEVQYV